MQPVRQPLPPPAPPPSRREVLASGRESPGPGELWYGLTARTRRTAAAAACLLLLAAGGYAVAVQASGTPRTSQQEQGRGTEQAPQEAERQNGPVPETALPSATHRRMPYPAQSARITFDRLTVSSGARRTFTVRLQAAATSSLTVLGVGQGYEGLDVSLAGQEPVTVRPGATRTLIVNAKVTDCEGVSFRARSPFLNVTLRNNRARQELSVIPGERYADALVHAFRTLCPSGSPEAAPRP